VSPLRVAPFSFDREWEFPLTPEAFWDVVRNPSQFPVWWGWLRSFESEGLQPGARTTFAVQGALPYRLRFEVVVERAVEARSIDTAVSGDLEGPASLAIAPDGDDSCRVRLSWVLEPRDKVVRRLAMVSHPLLVWSHDQVVQMGVTQFRRRLARERP
jgi:hypothetical protein